MSLRIHYFQHLPYEGLASIGDWARRRGHRVSASNFYADDPLLPALEDFDWLVVMGGTMGAYEEEQFPWLRGEKALIRAAVDAGKTVLGICLGSQLIASALGARVYPAGHREIGWWPVRKLAGAAGHPLFGLLPEEFTAFHWHGDTFELPAGAVLLAASAGCRHQAFSLGERVLGLQFHFEVTPAAVRQMLEGSDEELAQAQGYVQSGADILAHLKHAEDNTRMMSALLDQLEAAGPAR